MSNPEPQPESSWDPAVALAVGGLVAFIGVAFVAGGAVVLLAGEGSWFKLTLAGLELLTGLVVLAMHRRLTRSLLAEWKPQGLFPVGMALLLFTLFWGFSVLILLSMR